MKRIKAIDEAIEAGTNRTWQELGFNGIFGAAYMELEETGNELIDFSECVWEKDIPEIVKNMRENGIEEFTISSGFSDLIATLAGFEAEGCTMESRLVTVNARHRDFHTGEHDKRKAIKFRVN